MKVGLLAPGPRDLQNIMNKIDEWIVAMYRCFDFPLLLLLSQRLLRSALHTTPKVESTASRSDVWSLQLTTPEPRIFKHLTSLRSAASIDTYLAVLCR